VTKTHYFLVAFALIALTGTEVACWTTDVTDDLFGTQATIPDSETRHPTLTTADIPVPLDCHVHDDKSIIKWPNTPASGTAISDIGYMVADGDLLWAATNHGLMRLDVRTWKCDLFQQVLNFSLTDVSLLLPDGKGGLWVSTRLGVLLHFDGEHWRSVYEEYSQYTGTMALGFDRKGDMCVQEAYYRFESIYSLVYPEKTPQRPTAEPLSDVTLDRTLDCDLWQQVSNRQCSYTTAAGCDHIRHLLEQLELSDDLLFITAASDGDEVWLVYGGNDLYHWQNDFTEYSPIPYQGVDAVAIDPVYGGAWLATDERLIHVQTKDGFCLDQASPAQASFVYHSFPLCQRTFPGSASALVVDANNQVWAVNGRSVLRYEEADRSWQHIITTTYSADATAADPVQGVWVAGQGEILHLGEQNLNWPAPDVISPTTLLVDEDQRLWLGTLKDGVWTTMPSEKSDTLIWNKFSGADGLPDLRITALARGPHGHIYAAHHTGVSLFDPGLKQWITLPDSAPSESGWANALAFDRAGRLWVGYYPGATVRLYEDRHWLDRSLPPGKVYGVDALLVDSVGTLWAGVSSPIERLGLPRGRWYLPVGVWRWPAAGENYPGWESFGPELDDLEPACNCPILRNALTLALDAEGRIWVGGEGGVSVWEGE
jgi:ligand-binding sensor domain-containing protein